MPRDLPYTHNPDDEDCPCEGCIARQRDIDPLDEDREAAALKDAQENNE